MFPSVLQVFAVHAAEEHPASEGAEQRCGEHSGRRLEAPRVSSDELVVM